jgi:hypothetical protein
MRFIFKHLLRSPMYLLCFKIHSVKNGSKNNYQATGKIGGKILFKQVKIFTYIKYTLLSFVMLLIKNLLEKQWVTNY